MTDLYSFDSTIEDCQRSYDLVAGAYDRILNRIGLPFLRALADSGDMGGSYSHEYHYCSSVGEDVIYSCEKCAQKFNQEKLTNEPKCPDCSANMQKLQGAEIGHTFVLGDAYSKLFDAEVVHQGKKVSVAVFPDFLLTSMISLEDVLSTIYMCPKVPLQMGCYGIGVSRIMSLATELSSETAKFRLPVSISPFTVGVIPPKPGSEEYSDGYRVATEIAEELDKVIPCLYTDIRCIDSGV